MPNGVKPYGMMMGNLFGNMIRSITRLKGGGGFTTKGDRLIISGGLTISGELTTSGGGEFGWLIAEWEFILVENIELLRLENLLDLDDWFD